MVEALAKGYAIVVGIVILILLVKIVYHKVNKSNEKVIQWPWYHALLSVALMVLIFVMYLLSMFETHIVVHYSYEGLLVYAAISLPILSFCVFGCFYILNWKIELNEYTFRYTNAFGRETQYSYDEIYSEEGVRSYRSYYKDGRKLFSISYKMTHCDLLEKKLYGLGEDDYLPPKTELELFQESFVEEFLIKFMPSTSRQELKKLHSLAPQHGCLWNICENDLLENLKGKEAMDAYDKADKNGAIEFKFDEDYLGEDVAVDLSEEYDTSAKISNAGLKEFYVVGDEFSWCYIVTYGPDGYGPYFIKNKVENLL